MSKNPEEKPSSEFVCASDGFMHIPGTVSLLHAFSVWTSIRNKIIFL